MNCSHRFCFVCGKAVGTDDNHFGDGGCPLFEKDEPEPEEERPRPASPPANVANSRPPTARPGSAVSPAEKPRPAAVARSPTRPRSTAPLSKSLDQLRLLAHLRDPARQLPLSKSLDQWWLPDSLQALKTERERLDHNRRLVLFPIIVFQMWRDKADVATISTVGRCSDTRW